MPTLPAISIVMPVYNRAKWVSAAIESILTQTWRDFEFIVVDDGSSDGTAEVLAAYQAKDTRLRVLSLPVNVGQGMARALGHEAARGRYIAVMDSDDIALPERLATQHAFMEEHSAITLAGSRALKVTADGDIEMAMPADDGEIKARLLLADSAFVHPTVIMRRDFLVTHRLNYASERRGDDDYQFYNRLVACGATFTNLPQVLLRYQRHADTVTATTQDLQSRKVPLRRECLALYYPDLTNAETRALANIMQPSPAMSLKQAVAGCLAADKAMRDSHSHCGERKASANRIIGLYRDAVERGLTQLRRVVPADKGGD